MRRISAALFGVFLATLSLGAIDGNKIKVDVVTNKSALSYEINEQMEFTVTVDLCGESAEGLFYKWEREGDDGVSQSGKIEFAPQVKVSTSLNQPGFVKVYVHLVDKDGKKILCGKDNSVSAFAGAAVHPEKLSDCGEPADFDEFWAKQKERLSSVPFIDKVERKLVKEDENSKTYAVSIPCAGPRPVTGYLVIPAGAQPKSLPIKYQLWGYGTGKHKIPPLVPGYIYFDINAHGQDLFASDEEQAKFMESRKSRGHEYAFDPIQNSDPETAYFNGMALRVLRGLQYVKTLPEWNGKDILVSGGSQGGLQSMWALGLDPDITEGVIHVVWCCDMAGKDRLHRAISKWHVPYTPALDYYDPVFHAKRVKKARVDIARIGLGDHISPPSGLAILYYNLATPNKSARWIQGATHGTVPEKSERVVWRSRVFTDKSSDNQ